MCELQKGDRVIVTDKRCGYLHRVGKTGYIVSDVDPDMNICIEFDEHFDFGHDGGGLGEEGHCYWVSQEGVDLLCEEPEYERVSEVDLPFDKLMEM